jgi:hypothetical protein
VLVSDHQSGFGSGADTEDVLIGTTTEATGVMVKIPGTARFSRISISRSAAGFGVG